MLTHTLIPLFVATATPSEISRVEVVAGDAATSVLAYDGDDEVSAEVAVWQGDDGPRFSANFADGHYMSVEIHGDDAMVECIAPDGVSTSCDGEVASRLMEIEDVLAQTTTTDGGPMCGLHVALTVVHCA